MVSHTEVFHSVWMIVDAINECKELAFQKTMPNRKRLLKVSSGRVGWVLTTVWEQSMDCCLYGLNVSVMENVHGWAAVLGSSFAVGSTSMVLTCKLPVMHITGFLISPSSIPHIDIRFSCFQYFVFVSQAGKTWFFSSGTLSLWQRCLCELQVLCCTLQERFRWKQR
jgi:hypothetical protein